MVPAVETARLHGATYYPIAPGIPPVPGIQSMMFFMMLIMMLFVFPMAGLEVVASVMLIPMLGNPMGAVPLPDEMAVDPDVPMSIPTIVTLSPDKSRTRRRDFDDARWRRGDLNFNPR
jgi:hypothetical protein